MQISNPFDFPGKMSRVLYIKISQQAFKDNLERSCFLNFVTSSHIGNKKAINTVHEINFLHIAPLEQKLNAVNN